MHMGVQDDIDSSFCKEERINHIFWKCNCIKPFWEEFQIAVGDRCVNATPVTLNEIIVLFGHDSNLKSDDTFDLTILLANIFIYKCTIQKKYTTIRFV